jgi:Bacteriophage Sf6, terminase small subunit-like
MSEQRKSKQAGGRPTKFNRAAAARICHRLSTSPDNLETICHEAGIHPDTFYEWKSRHTEFSEAASRAMHDHLFVMGERLVDFSDRDVIVGDRSDSARVQQQKIRLETRRWYLSKRLAEIYGDRLQVDANVEFALPDIRPASIIEAEAKALPNRVALPPRGSGGA